jgi:hypothetical protein
VKFLKANELCPIHHSYSCVCHGEKVSLTPWGKRRAGTSTSATKRPARPPKFSPQPAVLRIEDPHYPGGFREICSDREFQRRKLMVIERQFGCCGNPECDKPFRHISEAQAHHIRLKGMGSAFRDDSLSNLIALCADCHRDVHEGRLFLDEQEEGIA